MFRPIQFVRLIKWQQNSNHPQFEKLISDLSPILGPSPLKVKETEQKRAEEERQRRQEQERKLWEEEQGQAAEKQQGLEEEKQRLAEQKQKVEEEQKQKKKEIEAKRREEKAKIKPDKPEPVKIKPSEPKPDKKEPTEPKSSGSRKTSNDQRFLLGDRIEKHILDVLELLVHANYSKDKLGYLREALQNPPGCCKYRKRKRWPGNYLFLKNFLFFKYKWSIRFYEL